MPLQCGCLVTLLVDLRFLQLNRLVNVLAIFVSLICIDSLFTVYVTRRTMQIVYFFKRFSANRGNDLAYPTDCVSVCNGVLWLNG